MPPTRRYARKRAPYRKPSAVRRRPVRRTVRRKKPVCNGRAIIFKSPNNAILPDAYFCKLRTRYQFSVAVAGFTGGATYQLILKLNDCFDPFSLFPATNITWMNAVNPVSGNYSAQDFTTLCNVKHYLNYKVCGAKLRMRCTPELLNDAIMVTSTAHTTDSGTTPAHCTNALLNKNTVRANFGAALGGPNQQLTHYVKPYRILGIKKTDWINDYEAWGGFYNASPTEIMYYTLNFATLDCATLTNAMPMEIELTQYVKFLAFANPGIVPV